MADLDIELLAWVLTYLVHSSALLGAAWIASRALGRRRRTKEALLVAAVLGGFLTSGAQVTLGFEPVGGRHRFAPATLAAQAREPLTARPAELLLTLRADELRALVPAPPGEPRPADPFALAGGAEPASTSALLRTESLLAMGSAAWGTPPIAERGPWAALWDRLRAAAPRLVLLALALVALARLVPLALGWLALRRDLAGAREVRGGALAEPWDELARSAGLRRAPRLLVCPRLDTPLTAGLLRPRVCLPERAVRDLSPSALRALLAHELAHVERRDPLRAFVGSLLERLLWFQPLNRAARRELEELAEHACDARALELGVRPIDLARCLTDVAGWLVARPRAWSAAPGMAARESVLGARVRRLVGPAAGPVAEPRAGLVGALALVSLAAVGAAAPGFAVERQATRAAAELAASVVLPAARPIEGSAALAPRPASAGPATEPAAPIRADAPSAAAVELEALLALLDEELLLLERELFELRASQLTDLDGGLLTRPLAEIEARLVELRARRAQLARLVPLLLGPTPAEHGRRPTTLQAIPVFTVPTLHSRSGKEPL